MPTNRGAMPTRAPTSLLRRNLRVVLIFAIWTAFATAMFSAPVLIDFDDRLGQPPPFGQGLPVPAQYMVHDQYLSLGVRFDSGGGGVSVRAPANPVSPPNTAGATEPGPALSYRVPITATFFLGDL